MKRVAPLSLLLAVLTALLFFARPAAAADWALSFGMSSQYARINATTVDSTGNTYIAGYFTNYSQPLGSTTLIRIGGGPNAFVAKINDAGTVLWARNYGGSTSSYGSAGATSQAIAVDASDNVYLSGDTDVPLTTPSVPGAAGPFVIKLDDTGTTLWAKVLGGTSVQNTKTTGIAVDGTGGVYLSGYSGNGTNPSVLGETVRGVQDAFALKLDASGTILWAKNYGGSGATTRANAIAVDAWGDVYLGGYFHSANLTYPALTRIGGADAFALKLDPSNGSPAWARNYGGSGAGAYAKAIAVDASGNVYLGGNFDSANLTTPALSLIGVGDVFAFKLDTSGAISGTGAWARNYGGSGAIAAATGIAVDASGNVYLAGDFSSDNLTTPALTKIGSTDAFALKLDSLGATTWARNYGGGGVDPWGYRVSANAFAIAVDASGNVHLGGSFDNGNLTSPALTFTPNGRTDALILKQTTVLPVVNSLSTASGGVSGGTVVTLSGYSLSGATAVNFGANPGTFLTVNSATSITVTVPASTTSFGAVDVTVTTPSGTGGTGNGLFTYAGAPSQLAAPTVTLTGNVATVSFTAPADNGSAITGYSVTTSPAGGVDVDAGSTATTHHIVGLALGTAYTFRVTAANAGGNSSPSSASASVTTPSSFTASSFGSSGAFTSINATAVDAAGNTYIAGSFAGASLTLGGTTLTRIGALDAFAAKINAAGSVLWAKNFGDSGLTYAYDPVSALARAIAVDGAGNVYLTGDTSGSLTTPALGPLSAWGASFALKLDASGATVWAQGFGGAATIHARSIAVDASGKVYLGGDFGNSGNFNGGVFGTPALTSFGNSDAFAFKLNADGSIAWAKNFGGSGAKAYGYGIAVDGSGNVYLDGNFKSANLTTPALAKIGVGDAFALKLDSSGATLWAKNFGGAGAFAEAFGIAVDGRGNVYLGGYFESGDLTTPALSKIGLGDAFAFKLDNTGATVWAKNFGGSGLIASVNAIAVGAAGNIALGGVFSTGQASSATNLTTPALTLIGNRDVFAFKLDANGAIGLAKNYGGSGASANANAIAMDAAGNITLGGSFGGNLTTPVLTAVGQQDGFILKQAIPPVQVPVSTPTLPVIPPLPVTIPGTTLLPSIVNMAAGEGPAFMAELVAMLSNALGQPLQLIGQNALGTVTLSGFNGGKLAFVPSNYQGSGDPRANGIYPLGDGRYQVVRNGQSLVITPALVSPDQLLALLPGVSLRQAENGVLIATFNGVIYAVQPGVQVQPDTATGNARLVMGADGYWHFIDAQGNHQILFPAFADPVALRNALLALDASGTSAIQLDGTAAIVFQGQRYTLVPDLTLTGVPTERVGQMAWSEGAARFWVVNNQPLGTAQGLTVKP